MRLFSRSRKIKQSKAEASEGKIIKVAFSIARFPPNIESYEIIERYEKNLWGQKVEYAIIRDVGELRYLVNEPPFSSADEQVYNMLIEDVLFTKKLEKYEDYIAVAESLLSQYGVPEQKRPIFVYYLMRNLLYGALTPAVFDNEHLEDVIVNSFEPLPAPYDMKEIYGVESPNVYPVRVVHRRYGNIRTNITITPEEAEKIIVDTISRAGKSITARNPLIDVMTPHGRFAAVYGGEVSQRHVISFRLTTPVPLAVTDLVRLGTCSPLIIAYLWLLQDYKKPYIIMGGVGSGKTTFSRAMLQLIPPSARVIIIEDTPELVVPHDNWTHLFVRKPGLGEEGVEIGYERLLREALRHKSDYVLVGEIRSSEDCIGWLNALAVGSGGITTLHANAVLPRLRAMKVDPHLLGLVKAGVFIVILKGGRRVVLRLTEIWRGEEIEGIPQWRETTLFEYKLGAWYPNTPEEVAERSKNLAEIQNVFGINIVEELRARAEFIKRHINARYWEFWKALKEEWWVRAR